MGPGLTTLIQVVQDGGCIALLGLIVYAFFKGWIYTAAAYNELKQRCERAETQVETYRSLAVSGANTAQMVAEVVKAVLTQQAGAQP